MKKAFVLCMSLLAFTLLCNAQNRALKFLGIPVDGYKSEMIKQLEDKGYTCTQINGEDVLTGEFNGEDVEIYIVTNNNKVWRIYIADEDTRDEYQIKLRFNTLCDQFERNSKYGSFSENQKIPMDEDISYEMRVNDKQYQATYYQIPDDPNLMKEIEELGSKFENLSSENIESDSLALDAENLFSFLVDYDPERFSKYDADFFAELSTASEDELSATAMTLMEDLFSIIFNREVWFTVSCFRGEYYISMYYDNGYNKASGEDL